MPVRAHYHQIRMQLSRIPDNLLLRILRVPDHQFGLHLLLREPGGDPLEVLLSSGHFRGG